MILKVVHLMSAALILFSCLDFGTCRTLPSYIKPCKRNDPNLEKCLVGLLESLRPRFRKGFPEMRLPSIEPFRLPEVRLDQGTGSVNFRAAFKNLVAAGAKDLVMKQLKIDWNTPAIFAEIYFPKLTTTADYDINGKILVLPINGNGKSNGTFTNITAQVALTGKFEQRNGRTYLGIKNKKISLKIGGMHLFFSNLFNGNKELSESTNKFFNENWKEIVPEVLPLVEDTIGEIMVQMTMGVLDTYSIEDLFPES